MKTLSAAVVALFVSSVLIAACTEDKPGKAGSDLVPITGTGGAGGSGQTPPKCPEGRGPAMVAIAMPDAPTYCIDTTEVTQGQYAVFAKDQTVDVRKQPPFLSKAVSELCQKYNHTRDVAVAADHPSGERYPGCPVGVYDPEKKPDAAMRCVDFCDAALFCQWAGKRLCGSVGGGGPLANEYEGSGARSEWYQACSQGGKTKYPYGNEVVAGRCDGDSAACVGTEPPFDQVRSLSGGVAEWVNACDVEGRVCARLGFVSAEEPDFLACDRGTFSPALPPQGSRATVGFRCCADLDAK